MRIITARVDRVDLELSAGRPTFRLVYPKKARYHLDFKSMGRLGRHKKLLCKSVVKKKGIFKYNAYNTTNLVYHVYPRR